MIRASRVLTSPTVSVIVPARNEEELLPRCLQSLLLSIDHASVPTQIIVVADCCQDETVRIANGFGCDVRIVTAGNRAVARNAGSLAASGKYFFFVDADTVVDAEFLTASLEMFDQGIDVLWYRQAALESCILPHSYFAAVNFAGRILPLFSPAIATTTQYFRSSGGFDIAMRSFEDIAFLHEAWHFGCAKLCNCKVKTSIRRVTRFGYTLAAIDFVATCLCRGKREWKPINP
jgi:glycosyltransferase involved in cell wall biosynthesis